jgi:hypothetical protein
MAVGIIIPIQWLWVLSQGFNGCGCYRNDLMAAVYYRNDSTAAGYYRKDLQ